MMKLFRRASEDPHHHHGDNTSGANVSAGGGHASGSDSSDDENLDMSGVDLSWGQDVLKAKIQATQDDIDNIEKLHQVHQVAIGHLKEICKARQSVAEKFLEEENKILDLELSALKAGETVDGEKLKACKDERTAEFQIFFNNETDLAQNEARILRDLQNQIQLYIDKASLREHEDTETIQLLVQWIEQIKSNLQQFQKITAMRTGSLRKIVEERERFYELYATMTEEERNAFLANILAEDNEIHKKDREFADKRFQMGRQKWEEEEARQAARALFLKKLRKRMAALEKTKKQ